MLKASHKMMIRISGAVWFVIGYFLLRKGVNQLIYCLDNPDVASMRLREEGIIILLTAALLVGWVKGRKILKRSALRVCTRIMALNNPSPIYKIYDLTNYAIIACMMLLGMSIKRLGLPLDIRGFICTAVGSALIWGSLHYFRYKSPVPATPN